MQTPPALVPLVISKLGEINFGQLVAELTQLGIKEWNPNDFVDESMPDFTGTTFSVNAGTTVLVMQVTLDDAETHAARVATIESAVASHVALPFVPPPEEE